MSTTTKHERFHYETPEAFKQACQELNATLPFSERTEILGQPLDCGTWRMKNRLGVQPMEGCDGTREGAPDELTFRRYERFSCGGAAVLWMEAMAVCAEGRANPRQLYLCEQNLSAFSRLNERIDRAASGGAPMKIAQLTHSGRYSKPNGVPEPKTAVPIPFLFADGKDDYTPVSDDYLKWLEEQFVEAAKLAARAGFDAVDVKACHRYLISELLGAFTRPGMYGGSFENRTRLLLNIVRRVKQEAGIEPVVRLNLYDAIPHPFGFGVSKEDVHKPDMDEPIRLLQLLAQSGVKLVDLSCGNPYYNPHVGRPYDQGGYLPPSHPLEDTARMLSLIRQAKQSCPELTVMATGFTWLREFAANVAAGGIEQGWFDLAGFGRQAFAYPDFANDILNGGMKREKCCVTCSNCTVMMRDGGVTGCPVRDSGVYAPLYKKGRGDKGSPVGKQVKESLF